MKVLMTTDTLGGVWTYTLELVRELARRDHEVLIATMGNWLTRRQRADIVALKGVSFFESKCKLEWMSDCWKDVDAAGDWLLELERKFKPDVVHLNNYVHGNLHWRSPALVVGHSCVLSWWESVKGKSAPTEWAEYRERVARGINSADYVIAPTATMLGYLQKYYGVSPPSSVVPNGRSASRFFPRDKRAYVMTVGRVWDEAKNVALVERAAPQIEWPVYVAGPHTHPDGGGNYVPDSVRHLGELLPENLAVWLGGASIYALPARYEPFGLSVLEAALCGCALVLSDIPSLVENWEGAAVFVPADDPDAMKDAVNGLIHDQAGREAIARKARIRAMQFTPGRMAEDYIRTYQEITDRGYEGRVQIASA